MSAIDQVLTGYGWQIGDLDQARAELTSLRAERDALRAHVAELEQTRQFQQGMIDGLNVAINIKDSEIENLQDRADILTPRRCRTCAREAAQEMRDRAVKIANGYTVPCDPMTDEEATAYHIMIKIRALPLPDCGDCNPLAPDEAKL